MKNRSLFLILFFVVFNLCATAENIKSVVFITIDTLRADHLSCYGYQETTSPFLDKFIYQGTRFAWAFSASSSTAPSHISMFAGLYPSFHSVGANNNKYLLNPEYDMLAEICLRHGFKTAAIVSNPMLSKNLKLDQGFQSYDDDFNTKELNRDYFEQPAGQAINKACAMIERYKGEKFFLWLHLQDPHGPYTPPREYSKKFVKNTNDDRALPFGNDENTYMQIPHYQKYYDQNKVGDYIARYDGEINFLDHHLLRLFIALEKAHLLKSTLVVITADHGEALGEDDFYFGHGHSVAMDQVHVPLAFIGPGIRKGKVVDCCSVSNIDVFSTILDLLVLPSPNNTQSRSLKRYLVSDKKVKEYPVFAESLSQRGVMYEKVFYCRDRVELEEDGIWKSQENAGNGLIRIAEKLFVMGAKEDIPKKEKVFMKKLLDEFSTSADEARKKIKKTKKRKVSLNEKEMKKLKSLGYI